MNRTIAIFSIVCALAVGVVIGWRSSDVGRYEIKSWMHQLVRVDKKAGTFEILQLKNTDPRFSPPPIASLQPEQN